MRHELGNAGCVFRAVIPCVPMNKNLTTVDFKKPDSLLGR